MKLFSSSVKSLLFVIILFAGSLFCQTIDDSELRKVETLGRQLYEYDMACWVASDSLMASNPDQSTLGTFLAARENGVWKVGFGRLSDNSDSFLLFHEAVYNPKENTCKVTSFKEPKRNTGFYFNAAKALEKMFAAVKPEAPPYNFAIIPAGKDNLYLYFYPAQASYSTYRFGGDTRYTYSIKSNSITDTLTLHKTILNMPYVKDKTQEINGTFSTAIMTSIPVETDILYVLSRKFPAQHYVSTEKWVFIITPDGKITKFPADKFKELGTK
ncbi:MAG TPA: hypothetical protein VHO43_12865 [Ignavibacteriales bacterium]|nr:hypothetical protein [Ignavibacteriales bacterium]